MSCSYLFSILLICQKILFPEQDLSSDGRQIWQYVKENIVSCACVALCCVGAFCFFHFEIKCSKVLQVGIRLEVAYSASSLGIRHRIPWIVRTGSNTLLACMSLNLRSSCGTPSILCTRLRGAPCGCLRYSRKDLSVKFKFVDEFRRIAEYIEINLKIIS